MTKKLNPKTRFAIADPATAAAGLFRVLPKGAKRQNAVVDVEHDGMRVRFISAFQLDDFDWRVFLAICALAGMDRKTFTAESQRSPAPTLWERFLITGSPGEQAVIVPTTAYAILREIGRKDDGRNRRLLSESLERLSAVSKNVRKGNRVIGGARLLSYAHDEDSGELRIGLSPVVAGALLGAQHVKISLEDIRQMKHPASVVLHGVLSARLRPRSKTPARYRVDTLAELAYGPPTSDAVKRKRRELVGQALAELDKLEAWNVLQAGGPGNGLVEVYRRGIGPDGDDKVLLELDLALTDDEFFDA